MNAYKNLYCRSEKKPEKPPEARAEAVFKKKLDKVVTAIENDCLASAALSMPAVFNRKLAELLALANPSRNYTKRDLAAVKKLARIYAIIIQRKLAEDRIKESRKMDGALSKLIGCFLQFGPVPDKNIDLITRTTGEILDSVCVLYNRLEDGLLFTISGWQAPADMPRRDTAKGHICFDVISGAKDRIFVARNLHKSAYAQSDPNVKKYNLKTYLGYPVSVEGTTIGSLCAAFQTDKEPAPNEIEIMSILAKALGIEEQRKRSENSLRKNEEILREVFHTAKDAIFIKDLQGRYVKANNFCAGLFGLTPEEMAGKTDSDIFSAETAEKLAKQDKTVIEKDRTIVVDNAMEFKTGSKVFNTVKTPLRDGGITGILGIARDVTRLKQLEAELVRVKAMQAVRKITGPAAHDFNNILAAINGYATLLLETLTDKNRARPEIMQIIKAVRRAAAVTEKLQIYGQEAENCS